LFSRRSPRPPLRSSPAETPTFFRADGAGVCPPPRPMLANLSPRTKEKPWREARHFFFIREAVLQSFDPLKVSCVIPFFLRTAGGIPPLMPPLFFFVVVEFFCRFSLLFYTRPRLLPFRLCVLRAALPPPAVARISSWAIFLPVDLRQTGRGISRGPPPERSTFISFIF